MAYHVEEAKERQREGGGDRKSLEYRIKRECEIPVPKKSVTAPVPEVIEQRHEREAVSKAGKLFNVSGRTVTCHTQEEIGWTSAN